MIGRMQVMGVEGDITVEWDSSNEESVKKAKAEFKSLKEAGYDFFESPGGKQIKRFSKKLSKVIAAPGVKKPADKKSGKRPKAMAGGPVAERVI